MPPIGVKDAILPFLVPVPPGVARARDASPSTCCWRSSTITSLLRARIGLSRLARRPLARLCSAWPVALVHGLGTGTDGKSSWLLVLTAACTLAVAAAVVLRVALAPGLDARRRLVALGAVPAVLLVLFIWAKTGPLQRGWALRAGTPASLIPAGAGRAPTAGQKVTATVQQPAPLTPPHYTATVSGSLTQVQPNSSGIATVQIDARTSGPIAGRLRATLYGVPLENGGLSMQSSDVAYATAGSPAAYRGSVTALAGTHITAVVANADGKTPPPRPRSPDQLLLRLGRRNPAREPLGGRDRVSIAVSRLLLGLHADGRPVTSLEHLHLHGPLPGRLDRESLLDAVERSELRGRGGAGFPTALKLRAVGGRRGRKVVLANGVEGEPPSGKDKVLLRFVPHLVLDGVEIAARAVGADQAIVAVSEAAAGELAVLQNARPRARAGSTGSRSESPLFRTRSSPAKRPRSINAVAGGRPRPTATPPRPFERGVDGHPTLVQNVETLAHTSTDRSLTARPGSVTIGIARRAGQRRSITAVRRGGATRRRTRSRSARRSATS